MITRVDVYQQENGCLLKYWEDGWQEGDPPFKTELKRGEIVWSVLKELQKRGFTCCQHCTTEGRALRGEITRIDFTILEHGVRVNKYPHGWTAFTKPLSSELKPGNFDVENALRWCEENGWTVYRWPKISDAFPAGARAWKGKPEPVRDRYYLPSLRHQFDAASEKNPSKEINTRRIDLAYCY
jgi:hypothetical protein